MQYRVSRSRGPRIGMLRCMDISFISIFLSSGTLSYRGGVAFMIEQNYWRKKIKISHTLPSERLLSVLFRRVPSILISFLEVMRFDHKKHRTSIRACTIASKCLKIGFSRSKNRIFPFTVDWWPMRTIRIFATLCGFRLSKQSSE